MVAVWASGCSAFSNTTPPLTAATSVFGDAGATSPELEQSVPETTGPPGKPSRFPHPASSPAAGDTVTAASFAVKYSTGTTNAYSIAVHHASALSYAGAASGAVLLPEEEQIVAHAVESRRREYAAVRSCARACLGRLGYRRVPILPGVGGAPSWPAGVLGSMTHCAGYAAAAQSRPAAASAALT